MLQSIGEIIYNRSAHCCCDWSTQEPALAVCSHFNANGIIKFLRL